MKHIKTPWLIQCATFHNSTRPGIDSILRLEYMGAAEFEFGAKQQSLQRVREDIENYVYFTLQFDGTEQPTKVVTVFAPAKFQIEVTEIISGLSKGSYQLKEYCDFKNWIKPSYLKNYSDFYWDLENDFMFWKHNSEFEAKFRELIKG